MSSNNRVWHCRQVVLESFYRHTNLTNDAGKGSVVKDECLREMSEDEFRDATRLLGDKGLIEGLNGSWGGTGELLRPHITRTGQDLIDREETVRDVYGPRPKATMTPPVQNFTTNITQHGGSFQLTQGNDNSVDLKVSFDQRRVQMLADALEGAGQHDLAAEARESAGDASRFKSLLLKVGSWLAAVASDVTASAITGGPIAAVAAALLSD